MRTQAANAKNVALKGKPLPLLSGHKFIQMVSSRTKPSYTQAETEGHVWGRICMAESPLGWGECQPLIETSS